VNRHKLIIGFDPEHEGGSATALGGALAEAVGATPVVATVVEWPRYLLGPENIEPWMTEAAHTAHRQVGADLGAESLVVDAPSVAEGLEELAVRERAALVVIGSCHRGAVGRTLAGSVGESLLHGSSRAVAVAPHGYEKRPIRNIGVAFDGSPEAWTALETATALAEKLGATLTLIAVAEHPLVGYTSPWTATTVTALSEAARADKQRLLELGEARAGRSLDVHRRLLEGEAGACLVRASASVDLLIAGSRGWGPLRRTVLGSATRRLIRDSESPVLVLPRAVGADPLRIASEETTESEPHGNPMPNGDRAHKVGAR
jgi:nucleotide-binding universal stress UspA family protein